MKKYAFTIMLQLLLSTFVFGQSADPGCSKLVTGKDEICSESCNTLQGCSSYAFHVDCGGTYYLRTWALCSSGANCAHCASCVKIYTNPPGTNPVEEINTLGLCENLDCDEIEATTALSSGNYIMYVCLVACTRNDAEVCCDPQYGCQAYGCLKWGSPAGCP